MDTSRNDDLARDAERLEQYAVDGERALRHPDVAAAVAAHPRLVQEIDAGLARLREQIAADPATSVVPCPTPAAARQAPTGPARHPSLHLTAASSRAAHPMRHWMGNAWPALTAVAAAAAVIAVVLGRGIGHTEMSASGPARDYATQPGQQATVTLADGTRIQLAPNSHLRVPDAFGHSTRTITLDGEALFDVTHLPGEPFVVRTGTISTRVLGTTFDVRHYPGDAHVRVAVVSGKVASRGPRTFVSLTAGTVGQINDSVATSAVVSDVSPYIGWTTDRLVFREIPVPELLRVLGQWYGVEFRLDDSTLLSRHLTVTLDHKSQSDAVAVLESLLHVSTTFDPSQKSHPVITLRPRATTSAERERRHIVTTPLEVGR